MPTIIDPKLTEVSALCRRYGVRKLELFGSATTGAFDPQTSDLDFLVDLDPDGDESLFHRYFGLKEDLETLFGRKVDIVMVGALENPYFIESVNKTRQTVYAAPIPDPRLRPRRPRARVEHDRRPDPHPSSRRRSLARLAEFTTDESAQPATGVRRK